jgi:hypothetical protein
MHWQLSRCAVLQTAGLQHKGCTPSVLAGQLSMPQLHLQVASSSVIIKECMNIGALLLLLQGIF